MEMYFQPKINRNKFRWCFIDIDGTLLTSTREITCNSKTSIKAITDMGIKIILASARMPKSIVEIQNKFDMDSDIICYNGALVKNRNEILINQSISYEVVWYSIQLQENIGGAVNLFSGDNWYVTIVNKDVKCEENIVGIKANLIDKRHLKELIGIGININKILILGNDSILKKISSKLIYKFKDLRCEFSKKGYLEVTNFKASKKNAMRELCCKYGIKRNEIIAIGDGYNDISMIKYAGFGIAMGNAPEIVKRNSNYVTLSNDNDGLSHFLCEFYGI